jgi:hypothetical protein
MEKVMELEHLIGEDKIKARSHAIWIIEGRPNGRAQQHWLRAIAELTQELERAWLAAMDEREEAEMVIPRPAVVPPPHRMLAGRVGRDQLREAA